MVSKLGSCSRILFVALCFLWINKSARSVSHHLHELPYSRGFHLRYSKSFATNCRLAYNLAHHQDAHSCYLLWAELVTFPTFDSCADMEFFSAYKRTFVECIVPNTFILDWSSRLDTTSCYSVLILGLGSELHGQLTSWLLCRSVCMNKTG